MASNQTARRQRLADELGEIGFELPEGVVGSILIDEIDYAMRPTVHERRVPSYGAVVDPRTDPSTWPVGTGLVAIHRPVGDTPLLAARRYADGLSSWLVRTADDVDHWVVFDRAAGSERDVVVLSKVLYGTVVQRHPNGTVRVAGMNGVLRYQHQRWYREPPLSTWIEDVMASADDDDRAVLEQMLIFAVHDLGATGIGAILIHRIDDGSDAIVEERLALPPPLDVKIPADLAPLRHALAQVDGAAVFDGDGVLQAMGVRLIPSTVAGAAVPGYRGMRHTAGRRYSYDDPQSTVIVVSEDGPVTVFRNGEAIGVSPLPDA